MRYKDKTNAEYMREYRAKNPEKIKLWPSSLDRLEQMAKYRLKNRTHINQLARLKNITDRQEMTRLLGNKCKACGEDDPIYFQIDHINNDGYLEKRSIELRDYLKNPKKFQLLCANCNQAKKLNGGKLYKPKKKRKR